MSDEELEALVNEERTGGEFVEPDEGLDETAEEIVADDEVEYEESDNLEQPEEDSDDDSTDEETEEVTDEGSEDDETNLDEGEDSEDEKTEEVADEETKEVQATRRTFKANGIEYNLTDDEIIEKFPQVFGQAMDYTKKMQMIKPWRQSIDAWESAELTPEDINLAIDVLKGDKDAISDLLKRTGVDALELDVENSQYQPKNYGRNETELAIKDVIDSIKDDAEYTTTYDVLDKQWDDRSREAFVQDPEKIRLLHADVKSGLFKELAPIASKLKVYGGGKKSDLDYYADAATQYFSDLEKQKLQEQRTSAVTTKKKEVEAVQEKQAKVAATKQASAKRKAAAPTKRMSGSKGPTDYLDTDEDFEKWYSDLQERM